MADLPDKHAIARRLIRGCEDVLSKLEQVRSIQARLSFRTYSLPHLRAGPTNVHALDDMLKHFCNRPGSVSCTQGISDLAE